ncbi:hypothetical protein N7G274_007471 [Stereocaulon virgatum]|uniref:Uncharacterized protein n=1 Tax=Stereocaulon virgatum TaxID=373712 RepID=A0ABR4A0Y9_9LECA
MKSITNWSFITNIKHVSLFIMLHENITITPPPSSMPYQSFTTLIYLVSLPTLHLACIFMLSPQPSTAVDAPKSTTCQSTSSPSLHHEVCSPRHHVLTGTASYTLRYSSGQRRVQLCPT